MAKPKCQTCGAIVTDSAPVVEVPTRKGGLNYFHAEYVDCQTALQHDEVAQGRKYHYRVKGGALMVARLGEYDG